MATKKGVASIVVVFFLVICSVGVGFGAYLLSQQIKKSVPSSRSADQVEEIEPDFVETLQEQEPQINPSPELEFQASPSPLPVLAINFSQSGTILDWDAQSESHTGIWKFLWDEPGALALNVKLEFNSQSQCDLGGGYQTCVPASLVNGTNVQLEGNRAADKVIVIRLKVI